MSAIEKGQFVLYCAYALVGLATFIVARMLLAEQESRAAAENLAELRDRKASSRLVKLTRPFFTQYMVPMVRGKPFWDNRRKIARRRLIAAGLRDELTPDEFLAYKLFLILFFPVVGAGLRALEMIDWPWYAVAGLGAAGFFWPDFWVYLRVTDRQKKILKSLPFIVDLLTLSTEAGLDFVGAIGKVVEKATPSPLIDELSQVLKEIQIGSSRQEALREMATRIDMTEVNSFVAILISADQMGASIGKILRQQSDQMRSERMIRAEKAGAAATQKIMFPIMFIIVPAVMLMIFGPLVLSFIYPSSAS
jgi:tight adherence protein C